MQPDDEIEAEILKEAALQYKKMWCTEQKDNQGNVRVFSRLMGNFYIQSAKLN